MSQYLLLTACGGMVSVIGLLFADTLGSVPSYGLLLLGLALAVAGLGGQLRTEDTESSL